jgi:hypothetical protein
MRGMGFSPREYRAMYFVAKRRGWKLALCQRPWIYFTNSDYADDNTVRLRLTEVIDEYDRARQEEARYKRLNQGAQHVRG